MLPAVLSTFPAISARFPKSKNSPQLPGRFLGGMQIHAIEKLFLLFFSFNGQADHIVGQILVLRQGLGDLLV